MVTGPIGDPVEADWALIGDGTALIVAANPIQLALVPEGRRDPRVTTTRGVGELILDALDLGIRDFLLAIGGSATNDGGTGMARALGIQFLDPDGNPLEDGGLALERLASVDMSGIDRRIDESRFATMCDGTPPPSGGAAIPVRWMRVRRY